MLHISIYMLNYYPHLIMTLLILLGVSGITGSNWGPHFTFQNTQCWALDWTTEQNFHLSYWPQSTDHISLLTYKVNTQLNKTGYILVINQKSGVNNNSPIPIFDVRLLLSFKSHHSLFRSATEYVGKLVKNPRCSFFKHLCKFIIVQAPAWMRTLTASPLPKYHCKPTPVSLFCSLKPCSDQFWGLSFSSKKASLFI